jgi:signal transduction histidine kinase
VRDISGIKQAEDELLTLNFELEERVAERTEELLEMQRRLIDGLEAERSQLAREIHDGPMQEIYALSYRLAGVDPNLSTEASQEEIQAINKELIRINNSLRAISQELLPSTLSKFGLDNAIRDHIERIQPANPELQISLDLSEDRDSLDKPVRLALYRIYQTAITNVIRHAQAEKVAIRFYQDKSSYVLEVEDDGTGFEVPTRFIDLAREGHLGLASAKERAQSAGGKMELHSRPDEGTLLRVVIPAHL